jgi:hypothetical protein
MFSALKNHGTGTCHDHVFLSLCMQKIHHSAASNIIETTMTANHRHVFLPLTVPPVPPTLPPEGMLQTK